jgi:cell division protein FtsX
MILAVYATLGVFLIIAARNPVAHLSLIWFTVWSSIVHASVMAVQSFDGEHNMGHLWGDVLVLYLVAALLGWLTPRARALATPG